MEAPGSTAETPNQKPTMRRQYSTAAALGVAFIVVSPVIGLYAIAQPMILEGGPASWITLVLVFVAQLLVALSFSEMASMWPIEGGLYQWVARMLGDRAGWMTGWLYLCTYVVGLASNAALTIEFLQVVIGVHLSTMNAMLAGLATLAIGLALNRIGPRLVKTIIYVSCGVELLMSVVLTIVLLAFFRVQPLSIFTQTHWAGHQVLTVGSFVAVIAIAGWAYNGFESATDLAEEVHDPRKALPIALTGALVSVAVLILVSFAAILLSVPDFNQVMNGSQPDALAYSLGSHMGSWAPRVAYGLIMISFFAGVVACQAAIARVTWAFARDNRLPRSTWLSRLSGSRRVPFRAMVVTTAGSAVLIVLSLVGYLYNTLVTFTTLGFFIVMWLALFARIVWLVRRKPLPLHDARFRLGRWSTPVTVTAFLCLSFELVNVAWPRSNGSAWYIAWGQIISFAFFAIIGIAFDLALRARRNRVSSARDAGLLANARQ